MYQGDRKKVVLFHGTVDRSETDLGFKLPSKVKMSMFKGYDLGLLGDIHKRQHLNKEETISYCGSLVQQNHGEDIGKGYLLWDMETLKSNTLRFQMNMVIIQLILIMVSYLNYQIYLRNQEFVYE